MFYRISNKKFRVKEITNYWKSERHFCIFDKQLPFEFNIEYKNPHAKDELVLIAGTFGVGFGFGSKYYPTSIFKIRMTESDCNAEIKKIDKLVYILEQEELKKEKILLSKYQK